MLLKMIYMALKLAVKCILITEVGMEPSSEMFSLLGYFAMHDTS